MKVFISGADGALGQEMKRLLHQENVEYVGVDIDQLDITDSEKTKEFVLKYHPNVILHFAAVSDVDSCEEDRENALRVNALSCQGLAKIANELDAKMLYTSTNFVFDGNTKKPYTESSQPNPINEYGRTKLLGEKYVEDMCRRHYIVRTSWLFGHKAKTYITKFLTTEEKPDSIDVICDQRASFTYIEDLAQAILLIIRADFYGVFHVVNKGVASWFDFVKRAKDGMKFKTKINPIKLDKLNLAAQRPLFSPLATSVYERRFSCRLASWEEAQDQFISSLVCES